MIVIRLSRNSGMRRVFSCFYDIAFLLVCIFMYADRDVKAVLLRDSSNNRGWNPGISDFDVTLITKFNNDHARLLFLRRFWKLYKKLRFCIPMFIEVDILDFDEFTMIYSSVCQPMQSLKRLRVVFSKLPKKENERLTETCRKSIQLRNAYAHLMNAFTRYEQFILPYYLGAKQCSNDVSDIMVEHCIHKMQPIFAQITGEPNLECKTLIDVYRILDSYCKKHPPGKAERFFYREKPYADTNFLRLLKEQILSALPDFMRKYTTIFLWPTRGVTQKAMLAIIVDEAVDDARLRKILCEYKTFFGNIRRLCKTFLVNDPQQFFPKTYAVPLILSPAMWKQWMVFYPFEAEAIVKQSMAVNGDIEKDLLVIPTARAYERSVVLQYGIWCIMRNNWLQWEGIKRDEAFCEMVYRLRNILNRETHNMEFDTINGAYQFSSFLLEQLRQRLNRLDDGLSNTGNDNFGCIS